ncbi:MAG: hypothetical protein WCI04_01655 [archaeon]
MQTQRQILRREQTEATVSAILTKAKYRTLVEKKGKEHQETKNAWKMLLRHRANLAEAKVKRLNTMLPKAKERRRGQILKQISAEKTRFLVNKATMEIQ